MKWEYLEITVSKYGWADSMGRKGSLVPREGASYTADLLNGLGEQGWELAGVAGSEFIDTHRRFLKRSKL